MFFFQFILKIALKKTNTDSAWKTELHEAQQVLKIFKDVAFMLQILEKPNTFTSETVSWFSL